MRTGKRRFIVFIGLFLMMAGMILGGSLVSAASPAYMRERDRISVSVLPTASQDAMKLKDDDVKEIADTLKAPVTWWGIQRANIASEKRQTQADVFAVGGPFADFHPVKMLYGGFLSRSGGDKGSIVLDSNLAWALFGTVDALGMEVKIQDKSYTVSGISSPDDSLMGLLSGSGTGVAYIAYDPLSNIPVSGMEASMEKAIPGKSLQAVKDAFGAQGKATSSFLFQDRTESALMDAESAAMPLAIFTAVLTVMIVITAKKVIGGMARSLRAFMKGNYFTDVWGNVLGRIALMLLAAGAAAGLIYALWLLTDFPFFLPARYIPGSFINLDFYKELIKTGTQEVIAAESYIPAPWDILHGAAMRIAGAMNMLSFGGIAVFASGLHLLKDARTNSMEGLGGWKSGVWDLPAVWLYIFISIGSSYLLCSWAGLPYTLPVGMAVVSAFGASFWASKLLYWGDFEDFLQKKMKSAVPVVPAVQIDQ